MKILNHSAELISVTPNALELIEKAGRLCYKSESDGDAAKFVKKILSHYNIYLENYI